MKRIINDLKRGNNLVYFITILISLLLFLPELIFSENSFSSILIGAGCSALASAIITIFIDKINEQNKKKRIINGRSKYLSRIYSNLIKLVGQFILSNEHLDDDWFGWDTITDKDFFTFKHSLFISNDKKELIKDKQVTIIEAINKLKDIACLKFDWGKFDTLDSKIKNRLLKTYSALLENNRCLIQYAIQLDNDRLYLDSEGYLSMDETNELCSQLSSIIDSLNLNYKMRELPTLLIDALEMLKKLSGGEEKIVIGMHISF